MRAYTRARHDRVHDREAGKTERNNDPKCDGAANMNFVHTREVEVLDVPLQMRSTSLEHAHISEASVNKSELVDSIAEGAGLSKADAERALNALIDAVQGAVANDDKVTLPGFGSFSRSSRAARTGRNPRTGEPVQIAASKGVKFSAGAAFKSAVNK